jgi:AraC-like DNA-binding protein
MRYLANWRMQLAKQMMREGARNIQEVAVRVGYDSEAAFNRAFKRATGSPPAAWRQGALSLSVLLAAICNVGADLVAAAAAALA